MAPEKKPLLINAMIGFLLVGILALGFVITYLSLTYSKIYVKPQITQQTQPVFEKSTPAPVNETNPEKGVYNILFLGYGGEGHDGALLTDSIIVIHIDTNKKKTAFISVPRDLWVSGNHKINGVGAAVGFQNVGGTIQEVTGLPINYFVAVDFGGFVKIIDNLNGITANTPVTFDDPFYPITGQENNTCGMTGDQVNQLKAKYSGYNLETQFTCRYEHLHFDKGPVNLDGKTALKYVRSRHGDSDFGRSLRQFAVLAGIENKLISIQSAGKIGSTIDTLSKIVRTDLTPGVIKSLIEIFGDPKAYSNTQIQLTTENVLNSGTSSDGQFILLPKSGNLNFTGIKKLISDNI